MAFTIKNLKPLLDRVLVRRMAVETKTLGGVIVPVSAQSKVNKAEVIAVGPGRKDEPMTVNVGETVLLPEYGGQPVSLEKGDEEKYFLFRSDDILAVLKE